MGGVTRRTFLGADAGPAIDPDDYLEKTGGTISGSLAVTGGLGVTGATSLGSLAVGAVTGASSIHLVRAAVGNNAYMANVTGDAQYRYQVLADGKVQWGDGSATPDTNLYRSAADTLRTDDALSVGGLLTPAGLLIPVYANAAARDAAITSPVAGRAVYVTDTGLTVYNGSAWSTIGPSAGGGIGSAVLLMRRANDLNLTANVEGIIPFDATDYDPYSWWVSASNHFLPTLAGWYEVTAACTFGAGSSYNKFIRVKKNGTGVNGGEMRITQSAEVTLSRTCLVLLNGTSDYVSVFAQINGTTTPAIISTAGPQASMHVKYAGPNIS